jgi:DNA-binding CsgD family transcriptional regulator
VAPRTIEFHKRNLMEKTGLHTTAELARFAAKIGLVADPMSHA